MAADTHSHELLAEKGERGLWNSLSGLDSPPSCGSVELGTALALHRDVSCQTCFYHLRKQNLQ